jgi:hypothetical protein
MERWYAFYELADPDGAIVSVAFLTEEDADAALLADPTLGYVEAPSNIPPADYYVSEGFLFRKPGAASPTLPVAEPVSTFAFYWLSDPLGTIDFVATMTEDDAELSITDLDQAYLPAPADIVAGHYYVSGGVLTLRPVIPVAVDKLTITADGVDTATISGLPSSTLATLVAGADWSQQSETVSTSTTLKTVHKLAHVVRLEKHPYRTEEVIINGV